MATTIESLIEGFPHPTILPIIGLPTFETITEVIRLLNANAASVQSELGGGALGHLAITVSPAVYATLSPTAFLAPNNPGTQAIIPPHSTAAQIADHHREHKEDLRVWRLYNNVDSALKQQLIRACEPMYLRSISNRMTGFANVSTRSLIVHLLTSYGLITPTDLAANDIKMKQAYDPSQPVETLFAQIEDAVDFADSGQAPYSPQQVVAAAYTLVFNTGIFSDACRDWRRRPPAEHTWANFKVDFTSAHHDLRLAQTTAQGGGFHGANAAMESFANETADALANLAEATASDRATVAQLTMTNATLTTQLANVTKDLERMKIKLAAQPPRQDRPPPRPRFTPNNNYCWTHGYKVGNTHTSANCNFPATGHQKEAIRGATLGGSEKGKNE
jgi:hypothetical protein